MTMTSGTTTTLWNKSHSTISESINQALVYLKSSKVSQDAIWSVVVGVVLGLAILLLLTAFPGKPLGIAYGTSNDQTNQINRTGISPSQIEKLQTRLGLSEQEVMQAIKSAERQMDHGEAFSFFQILNLLVYISLASGLIYFINRDYGNVITIWFVNAFPREAETLGLHNK